MQATHDLHQNPTLSQPHRTHEILLDPSNDTVPVDPWVPAAQAAINAHNAAANLEIGLGAEIDVFQLIASLLIYCDHHTLNFDLLVEQARDEFRLEK